MEIKFFTQISILKIIYKWNSQLAKASWCQRQRWRNHLPYRILQICESGI